MQKNVTPGRRKGCPNYPPEFKQQLVAASCEPGISISKLALENGINANLLFKWRQQWREGSKRPTCDALCKLSCLATIPTIHIDGHER
ncbi:transposase [Escherichia coli]|uniref:transposase n=1 Tax=Escherichia coli TaxID=562 RepID=UPI00112F9C08|nr:transposase [Escherichia coli]